MKRELLPFAFVSITLLFLSILPSAMAAEGDETGVTGLSKTFIDRLSEIFKNLFSKGTTNYDYFKNVLSPEILFGILIFLVIFAIVSNISLFASITWLPPVISIVIAILAAGFISPDFIQPLLNQYEAIGVLITFAVPFALLFYFLKEIAPTNRLVQKVVWGAYFIILGVTYIINFDKIASVETAKTVNLLYFLLFVSSFAMIWFSHKIIDLIWKNELETAFEKQQQIFDLIHADEKLKAWNALQSAGALLPLAERARLESAVRAMAGPAIP